MADSSRTVRVSGLPSDMEENRLKDKLSIHFLRSRNGGGDIDSLVLVSGTLPSALITFEDHQVAQSVIQRHHHILEVDGKKYKLTVTKHCEGLDPDQIISSLSATVDYNQLPRGLSTLTSFVKSHHHIQVDYSVTEGCCVLSGPYSKVQAALAQLLGIHGGLQSAEKTDIGKHAPDGSHLVQKLEKSPSQEFQHQSRKVCKKKEKDQTDRLSDEYRSGSNRDLLPAGEGLDFTAQEDGAVSQAASTSVEDFSLMVDADMFQYLQKHCWREYQSILSQYGVEVVDVTNQGLTTLYLQVASGGRGREQERLKSARRAISRLYQENETKIRRTQLPKSLLSPRAGLQSTMENLRLRLPKLLLNEDDQNVYIIGSSSDVSEAKFLLLELDKVKEKKGDVSSLHRYPSYDSSPTAHIDEKRPALTTSSTVGSLHDKLDQMSDEDDKRAEGARRYKLAARFKDSGLLTLGDLPTDFSFQGNLSPKRHARVGPMLGRDVLSETVGTSGDGVSRAVAQNTGGDILFKSGYGLPSSKTCLNPESLDARPNASTLSLSTTLSSLSEGNRPHPPGSGSSLKRASSFSGTPQQKAEVMVHRSQDDSSRSTVSSRGRFSSFSTQTEREKQEVHSAELAVSRVMWRYIKEAYGPRVEDLTSDVQVKERHLERSTELTLTVRGAVSSRVSACQQELQKLVDLVSSDFFIHELRLSDLGITDAADETLQVCCSEVRSRFKKVTIQISKKSLYLLGPKELCSQVAATLTQVFSGDFTQLPDQSEFSSNSPPMWSFPTSLEMKKNQSTCLNTSGKSLIMPQSQTDKTDRSNIGEEWKTTYSNDFTAKDAANEPFNQPLTRKEYIVKEKVITVDSLEMDGQTDQLNQRVNGVGSAQTDGTGRGQVDIQDRPEESNSGQRRPRGICVCGTDGASVIRTKCGVAMCSPCLEKVHTHCRVCEETAQKPRGIHGNMSRSKLSISLPGHIKDCVLKITYNIPDGIQGDGHPSPGKPFKGGQFEAFFPDCEMAKKLLPQLEKAFRRGLTFTVAGLGPDAKVVWDGIPHKTSLQGGKSRNGYPDASYLKRLSEILTSAGIE
ncbi:uncharacterized protein KZ484_003233 [Pholidichthys leucotaenia]